MAMTATFYYRNPDSTVDFNKHFAAMATRGILSQGTVSPTGGNLLVTVSAFTALSGDGMLVTSDAPQSIATPCTANATNYVCLYAQYNTGAAPTLQLMVMTEAAYNASPVKSKLVVFARVVVPAGAATIQSTYIKYDVRDTLTVAGRDTFFGAFTSLGALTTATGARATELRLGDVAFVSTGGPGNTPNFYVYSDVAGAYTWVAFGNYDALATSFATHASNTDFVSPNAMHLSVDQFHAASGSNGVPSSGNRYVTESDTRILTSAERLGLNAAEGGAITGSNPAISKGASALIERILPILVGADTNEVTIPGNTFTKSVFVGKQGLDTSVSPSVSSAVMYFRLEDANRSGLVLAQKPYYITDILDSGLASLNPSTAVGVTSLGWLDKATTIVLRLNAVLPAGQYYLRYNAMGSIADLGPQPAGTVDSATIASTGYRKTRESIVLGKTLDVEDAVAQRLTVTDWLSVPNGSTEVSSLVPTLGSANPGDADQTQGFIFESTLGLSNGYSTYNVTTVVSNGSRVVAFGEDAYHRENPMVINPLLVESGRDTVACVDVIRVGGVARGRGGASWLRLGQVEDTGWEDYLGLTFDGVSAYKRVVLSDGIRATSLVSGSRKATPEYGFVTAAGAETNTGMFYAQTTAFYAGGVGFSVGGIEAVRVVGDLDVNNLAKLAISKSSTGFSLFNSEATQNNRIRILVSTDTAPETGWSLEKSGTTVVCDVQGRTRTLSTTGVSTDAVNYPQFGFIPTDGNVKPNSSGLAWWRGGDNPRAMLADSVGLVNNGRHVLAAMNTETGAGWPGGRLNPLVIATGYDSGAKTYTCSLGIQDQSSEINRATTPFSHNLNLGYYTYSVVSGNTVATFVPVLNMRSVLDTTNTAVLTVANAPVVFDSGVTFNNSVTLGSLNMLECPAGLHVTGGSLICDYGATVTGTLAAGTLNVTGTATAGTLRTNTVTAVGTTTTFTTATNFDGTNTFDGAVILNNSVTAHAGLIVQTGTFNVTGTANVGALHTSSITSAVNNVTVTGKLTTTAGLVVNRTPGTATDLWYGFGSDLTSETGTGFCSIKPLEIQPANIVANVEGKAVASFSPLITQLWHDDGVGGVEPSFFADGTAIGFDGMVDTTSSITRMKPTFENFTLNDDLDLVIFKLKALVDKLSLDHHLLTVA